MLLVAVCRGQIAIYFNAAIYGQSVDGLPWAQIVNSSAHDVVGNLTIKVREVSAGNVLSITVKHALLRMGSNAIDRAAFSKAQFLFSDNYYGMTARQSGKFPEGEYEYCFEIDLDKVQWPSTFFENCFLHQLQPLTPLLLINPVDGDESCNTRPDFTWQPPLPMPAEARSRLILTELRDKQDIAEAINFNIPLINQGNIQTNQLMYPSGLPELRQGKKYAWQVIVYSGKTILKRSEIWQYTVKCDEKKEEVSTDSYRELKEAEDGNYYIAGKVVRFSFNNPYNAGDLNYSIVSMSAPDEIIKGLPSLKLSAGLNKHEIDLSEIKSFKNNQEYMLKVKLATGRELQLRFLYKQE